MLRDKLTENLWNNLVKRRNDAKSLDVKVDMMLHQSVILYIVMLSIIVLNSASG